MSHWSGKDYHRVSEPVAAMVQPLLAGLSLDGDETIIDLGCGSGRVSAILAERVPSGKLIAVDQSSSMIATATEELAQFDNVEIIEADITTVNIESEAADLVFSSAVFHWIKDHDLLFDNIAQMLTREGELVAQCGGEGNVNAILAAADEVRSDSLYKDYFAFWQNPFYFAGPEETEELLLETGFTAAQCYLQEVLVEPDEPEAYMRQVILGHYLDELPGNLQDRFIDDIISLLPRPVVVDYVRLNISARA